MNNQNQLILKEQKTENAWCRRSSAYNQNANYLGRKQTNGNQPNVKNNNSDLLGLEAVGSFVIIRWSNLKIHQYDF